MAKLSIGEQGPTDVGRLKDEVINEARTLEERKYEAAIRAKADVDKDFLCPICFQTMEDAFLTICGHSFCYACIMTHLNNKSNCPCCSRYLTNDQLYPNFLLTKLMKKASATKLLSNASPTEHLRLALQHGADLPAKELDALLQLLGERKRKLEQEEADSNMEILVDFLHCVWQRKQDELHEIQDDLQFLKEDIETVEERRQELLRTKAIYCKRLRSIGDTVSPADVDSYADSEKGNTGGALSVWRGGQGGAFVPPDQQIFSRGVVESQNLKGFAPGKKKDMGVVGGDVVDDESSESHPRSEGVFAVASKKRVLDQFEDLQETYLRRRRQVAVVQRQKQMQRSSYRKEACKASDTFHDGLDDFQSVLTAFTRYRNFGQLAFINSRLRVIAELHHQDLFHTSNIVSSIEFDRDDELFATAGVSRRIKVFNYATVVNELADIHCPEVEIPTRAKLSCLSWNKCIKPLIASSDYEGIVTVWDVNTKQSVMEYEEHEKRAWSVDFSRTEPSMLVSGSDDGKVKVWCIRQENSALSIDMKANICCVKYNPGSSYNIAVGSADHHIHYFDLRNASVPLYTFKGHRKAVSYVKFVSPTELASASTDNTLRLWDVQKDCSLRTLRGHTNEKNFVGLSVNNEYIACGSETNEVFVYHKAMSKPAAWHSFWSQNPEESDDDTSHFISAVCWKSESPTMLAANSQGKIKVLVLAP